MRLQIMNLKNLFHILKLEKQRNKILKNYKYKINKIIKLKIVNKMLIILIKIIIIQQIKIKIKIIMMII